MEEGKKKSNIKEAIPIFISLGAIAVAAIWSLVADMIPFVPSGTVIDDDFLNTLKYLTIFKYAIWIPLILLIIVPLMYSGFKHGGSGAWKGVAIIVSLVILFVFAKAGTHVGGLARGIFEEPTVKEKTISMKVSSRRRDPQIRFKDKTRAYVSHYHFMRLEEGEDVYVVYCDNEPIGVFSQDEYSLDD